MHAEKLPMRLDVESQDLLYAVVLHPKFRQGIVNIVEYMIHSSSPHIHFPQVNPGHAMWRALAGGWHTEQLFSRWGIQPDALSAISAFPPPPHYQQTMLKAIVELSYAPLPPDIQYRARRSRRSRRTKRRSRRHSRSDVDLDDYTDVLEEIKDRLPFKLPF